MQTGKFLITASHPAERWAALSPLTIVTRDEPTGGNDVRHYATHPELGCGKAYGTRAEAARALVLQHGYCVHSVVEMEG